MPEPSLYQKVKLTLTARFNTVCPRCGKPIRKGDAIEWGPDHKATHPDCEPGPTSEPTTPQRKGDW